MSLPLTARPIRPLASRRKNLLAVGLLSLGILLIVGGILGGVVPGRVVLSAFLAALAGVFLLWRTGSEFDVLHPVRVFGFIWCSCLALASLRLVTAISEWGSQMWVYVLLALASFVGGFFLVQRFLINANRSSLACPTEATGSGMGLSPARALLIAALCLAAGLAALFYEYRLIGEIPIFAPDIDQARTTLFALGGEAVAPEFEKLSVKVIHLFVLGSKWAVFLACIVLFQKRPRQRGHVVWGWLVVLAGSLAYASQGGRMFAFELAVTAAALFHYLRRRLSIRQIALGLSLMFLFLSVGLYFRLARGNPTAVETLTRQWSKFPEGQFWDSIALGYATVTTPFEVFYRLTEDLPSLAPGSHGYLFYSLHRFVPRESIQVLTAHLYGGAMIVPTFLGEFYADFGLLGIIFGPLVLGIVYGYVYQKAAHSRSIYFICLNGMLLFDLAHFAYSNPFSYYLTWIVDAVAMAVLIFLARPRVSHLQAAGAKAKPRSVIPGKTWHQCDATARPG